MSPGIGGRPDLDVYHRGASVLENVDVSQTGGVARRHGMKRVIAALEGSVMVPYVYSTADRFLVEVSPALLRACCPLMAMWWLPCLPFGQRGMFPGCGTSR